jgi:fructose-1-phosphate kinase PfkB-like protein
VITVTLNPSIDRTLWIRNFRAGSTFVADRSEDYAGGKGVNTSRALLRMGVASTATGILGKRGSRFYLDILDQEGIDHRFLSCEGRVRTNVTVLSGRGGPETHIRDRGPVLPRERAETLLKRLEDTLLAALEPENDSPARRSREELRRTGAERAPGTGVQERRLIVVFSGSLPEGLSPDTYARLIRGVKTAGAHTYLDTSGEPLRLGLESQPFFIKPNRYEVQEALGFLPRTEKDYLRAVETFHGMNIPLVMISRGEEGLILSDGRDLISAAVSIDHPLNSVGSGDAAVAGGVLGFLEDLSLEQRARLACAMGGANTLSPGGGVLEKNRVLELSRKTRVSRL